MPPTCPWTAGYLLSRKCIHPQQNSGLKLSMNIRTLTSTQASRQAVLETSRGHPYSFRERYREKYCFTPSPATVDFVSSSPAHAMSL
ncbi:hypothetical protein TNCT_404351 [Trichonephila clavata]|uniref:Uncharacterized protein n=1 Tax=Trichonephila clavata TaxID=2740835 RepID=A0A8X6HCH6_TRICU|nr:hypothetical protein TNCT_404351 [Trichonephila clavata]